MMSRNKREGEYCGRWREYEKGYMFNKRHHRLGNTDRDFGDFRISLREIQRINKGEKNG